MSRPCSPRARSRPDMIARLAADFANGAGTGPSGLVVMILDDDGLLAAVRQADAGDGFTPADVEAACTTVLDLSPPVGPAAAAVVSINLGFDAGAAAAAWLGMRRYFEQGGAALVDWLLVDGETTTSLSAVSAETGS